MSCNHIVCADCIGDFSNNESDYILELEKKLDSLRAEVSRLETNEKSHVKDLNQLAAENMSLLDEVSCLKGKLEITTKALEKLKHIELIFSSSGGIYGAQKMFWEGTINIAKSALDALEKEEK